MSIESGTVNGETVGQFMTAGAITVGMTAQNWSKLAAGPTYTSGSGVTITGGVITATGPYAPNVPSGSTSAVVPYGLGTTDVHAAVYEALTGNLVEPDVQATSTMVTLTFAVAPATGQYRVIVVG